MENGLREEGAPQDGNKYEHSVVFDSNLEGLENSNPEFARELSSLRDEHSKQLDLLNDRANEFLVECLGGFDPLKAGLSFGKKMEVIKVIRREEAANGFQEAFDNEFQSFYKSVDELKQRFSEPK